MRVGRRTILINDAFDPETSGPDDRPRVGPSLTQEAIVEQHGGQLRVESEPEDDTYARMRLPLRVRTNHSLLASARAEPY